MAATESLCNAYDTYLYKKKFDEAYLSNDFASVCQYQMTLRSCRPSIAVSSLFSLDDMPWPDDVARVALNIFPSGADVQVVFSYLKQDEEVASAWLSRVLTAHGDYQKYLISKIVLQHCDNLVISPVFFNRLSEATRNRIVGFFQSTVLQNRSDHEDQNLFLFW
jgi:hypothetical protein